MLLLLLLLCPDLFTYLLLRLCRQHLHFKKGYRTKPYRTAPNRKRTQTNKSQRRAVLELTKPFFFWREKSPEIRKWFIEGEIFIVFYTTRRERGEKKHENSQKINKRPRGRIFWILRGAPNASSYSVTSEIIINENNRPGQGSCLGKFMQSYPPGRLSSLRPCRPPPFQGLPYLFIQHFGSIPPVSFN